MTFLIEPYSAHQKPPKKKHWMEIAEEEALHHRMMMETEARNQLLQHVLHEQAIQEHLALREAAAKQNQTNLNNQNIALPQYTPQPASQQVQDGQFASPAGGAVGYEAVTEGNEGSEVANFSFTPSSGIVPLQVFFTNLTPTPENDTFFWNFGSGSTTSNVASPGSRTYTKTGSYTVTLQSTSSTGNATEVSKGPIVVVSPAINAAFTIVSQSLSPSGSGNVAGNSVHIFTDATAYNGAVIGGTATGTWNLGDGTTFTYTYLSGGFAHFYSTGSFTASLVVTESLLSLKSSSSRYIIVVPPTVTIDFTFNSSSFGADNNYEPMTASLVGSSSYNGGGTLTYNWYFTDDVGSIVSQSTGITFDSIFGTAGGYTASLQLTESTYKITAVKSQRFTVLT